MVLYNGPLHDQTHVHGLNIGLISLFDSHQISAKRGTALKFEAEANLKVLVPNCKQSSILIYKIRAHTNAEALLGSNYLKYYHVHTNNDSHRKIFKVKYEFIPRPNAKHES